MSCALDLVALVESDADVVLGVEEEQLVLDGDVGEQIAVDRVPQPAAGAEHWPARGAHLCPRLHGVTPVRRILIELRHARVDSPAELMSKPAQVASSATAASPCARSRTPRRAPSRLATAAGSFAFAAVSSAAYASAISPSCQLATPSRFWSTGFFGATSTAFERVSLRDVEIAHLHGAPRELLEDADVLRRLHQLLPQLGDVLLIGLVAAAPFATPALGVTGDGRSPAGDARRSVGGEDVQLLRLGGAGLERLVRLGQVRIAFALERGLVLLALRLVEPVRQRRVGRRSCRSRGRARATSCSAAMPHSPLPVLDGR